MLFRPGVTRRIIPRAKDQYESGMASLPYSIPLLSRQFCPRPAVFATVTAGCSENQ